jgi:hypothetical protein
MVQFIEGDAEDGLLGAAYEASTVDIGGVFCEVIAIVTIRVENTLSVTNLEPLTGIPKTMVVEVS